MNNNYQLAKGIAVNLIRGAKDATLTRELIAAKVDTALTLNDDWKAEIDREALIKDLETQYNVWIGKPQTLEDPTGHKPWLSQKRASIGWSYWERYKLLLSDRWPAASVDGLEEVTDAILMQLEEPTRDGPWDRRGLVVGHVQSGKTANYIGLINKAVDAGYRVIVVLAGIHKSLRSQTQIRLDEGFLGYESVAAVATNQKLTSVGVGRIAPGLRPNSITNRSDDGDFKRAVADRFQINPGADPLLFVIKKNASVLKNLLAWVEWAANGKDDATGRSIIPGVPLLVIDDEADHASVDTREQTFDEDGTPDPEHDPTIINHRIRRLLNYFEKAAYVGYTATPFANIFIHESGKTLELGDDLFPRSFIINLPAPSDYIGPLKVFGMDAHPDAQLAAAAGLPIIRQISDQDPGDSSNPNAIWMPPKHDKTLVPLHEDTASIPPSLQEAIQAFVLACAARRTRGQVNVHNSMLVHVTRFTDVQEKVFEQVKTYLNQLVLRVKWGEGKATEPEIDMMRRLWEEDFLPTTQSISGDAEQKTPWEVIEKELWAAASAIQIKRVNGFAPDILDYETHREHGLSVIAIGGDKLARGLTLEGLTVSYFLRATKMYDTLMQMGRWFGYRPGYLDLCRMYMTSELEDWFEHVTAANEELRQEFDRMAAIAGTPRDYGLRVKSHPSLIITSRVKMRHGTELDLSFAGDISETTVFSVDHKILDQNLRVTEALMERLGLPYQNSYQDRPDGKKDSWEETSLWSNVPADVVAAFFKKFATHEQARRINGALMAEYIEKAAAAGEMASWTVALIGKKIGKKEEDLDWSFNGIRVGLSVRRGRFPKKGPLRFTIQRLLSPRDEAIDLDLGEYSRALELTQDHWRADPARSSNKKSPEMPSGPMIRHVRPKTRSLLLLYPLNYGVIRKDAERDNVPAAPTKPVVGFAVSFPATATRTTVKYRVNNVYWEQEYGAGS